MKETEGYTAEPDPKSRSVLAADLARMFERAPGLIVLVRGPDHVFEYANPAYFKLIGRHDVIGSPVKDVLPELVAQGFVGLLDEAFRTGEPHVGRAMPIVLNQGPSGETVRYYDFVYQPLLDASGHVDGILGQGIDVTDRISAQQELEASEVRLANIFNQVAAGIAQYDRQGVLLMVNDRQCELLGQPRERLLGLPVESLTHVDDRPAYMELFRRLVETGEPFVAERRCLRGDGSVFWGRDAVSLIRDRTGQAQYAAAVLVDVTREKVAELALRRSEATGSAVMEAALDSIIIIDADSRVIEWNKAAELTFGFPRDQAIGADLPELIIPPELREAHREGMRRFMQTGRGPVIGQRIELEGLTRGGGRLPIELAVSPVNLEGRPSFVAYLRDISSRRAAEAALRESEHRLRATYENAFAAIGEVDRDGRFLRVNEQFSAITGYTREELLERSIWDITHPEDVVVEKQMFQRQMAGESPVYSIEKRYVHKDQRDVWVELSASTVDDAQGRPVYGVRVARDVSERRKWIQHQRLLLDELDHRVKNTLATVQSIAFQTARTAADPQEGQALFIDRLMALSRAHDVLTRQSWEGAALSAIIENAIRPFGGLNSDRFKVDGPPVWLAPSKALALALALHELATNASKYGALTSAEGCVILTWTVTGRGSQQRLHFSWREEGGPRVEPPSRRGFGMRLLDRGLAQEFEGEVRLAFDPEGVTCTVDAPLSES